MLGCEFRAGHVVAFASKNSASAAAFLVGKVKSPSLPSSERRSSQAIRHFLSG